MMVSEAVCRTYLARLGKKNMVDELTQPYLLGEISWLMVPFFSIMP